MAGEQEQGIDRRRALGMIGMASAAAAAIGVPVAALAASDARKTGSQVELAAVRREFASGATTVPMEEILPDGVSGAELLQAGKVMEQRIGRVVEMLLESGRADRARLIEAKHSMHRARAEVKAIVAGVNGGTLRPVDARAKARTMFATYFSEMKAHGAS